MAWIKRNLALVISGVLAIGLLGWGGWYFWSAVERNKEVDNEIEQTKRDIERYLSMPVTPTASNLNAARRELERLNQFIAEGKKMFPPTPAPTEPLNALTFKSLLENTVNELYQRARTVGIELPTNYYFSFENQRLPVTFPNESLLPLRERLLEVQTLANILLDARVIRLGAIRRARVPGETQAAGAPAAGAGAVDDYVKGAARSNPETGMVLWPYELRFECFTPELATVLGALQDAKYGFVVKAVHSEPVATAAAPRRDARATPDQRTVGRDPRTQRQPNQPPPVRPGTLETVVNERQLQVTLQLEAIKPGPPTAPNR